GAVGADSDLEAAVRIRLRLGDGVSGNLDADVRVGNRRSARIHHTPAQQIGRLCGERRARRCRDHECDERRSDSNHGASTTTSPQGPWPTGIFLATLRDSMSMTDTSSDGPLAVYSVLPSGETPIPHGRSPGSTEPITLSVPGWRTTASFLRPRPA